MAILEEIIGEEDTTFSRLARAIDISLLLPTKPAPPGTPRASPKEARGLVQRL